MPLSYVNTSGNNARYDSIIDTYYNPANKIGDTVKVDFKGKSLPEILHLIRNLFRDSKELAYVYNPDFQKLRIVFKNNTGPFCLSFLVYAQVQENYNNLINIYINSESGQISDLISRFDCIKADKLKYVDWLYLCGSSIESNKVKLKDTPNLCNSAYPWLKFDPVGYFKSFLDSKSSTLLLFGPPGTGKSSFISYMIKEFELETMITYDRDLLNSDQLYSRFISSKHNLLLIEDADTLLLSREKENNHTLHKILNAADGIVDTTGKKIIFTANAENKSRIDPAITREGRCFGSIDFRNLTLEEATKVCEELDVPLPSWDASEFAISEIYNNKKRKIETVGF